LSERREQYDIVYVSGDTDSFAQPRTNEGLDLLEALLHLNVDVLFTTRYVFTEQELERLRAISIHYRALRLLLIGCVSISQMHHPELEPPPIKGYQQRVDLLRKMQAIGIVTALTIRPFIPSVPASEYCEIANLGSGFADVVLGGDLYLDSDGTILRNIRAASGSLDLQALELRFGTLDFSLNGDDWITLTHAEAVVQVGALCEARGKPFFTRSAAAINWIRDRRSALIER
jgi:hypothetical protein